ncbi:piggyBac transposable element-derived protein 4-like [Sipha flava]|uniref:PiggyBac transposable element-derived protein 4-like n=1 Tax=Sipha flava TaxID=143950 RepID=A0A8B8GCU9_9HEMI|nr:piggyBac transposable element-derived protein 4-like [Sipha flava]
MPNKPTKRGYKVWTRADEFGYVCQFKIYTGKTNNIVEKNLGARVIKDMVRDLIGKYYIVYFDHYFSSSKLMADLLEYGVLDCGQYEWQATVTGIIAIKWKDNKGIHFLSNFHDLTQESQVNRKQKDGTTQIIVCLQLVKDYNAHMGYVDKADMLMTLYKIDRKSKRCVHNRGKKISLKHFRLAMATALIGNSKPSLRRVKKIIKI